MTPTEPVNPVSELRVPGITPQRDIPVAAGLGVASAHGATSLSETRKAWVTSIALLLRHRKLILLTTLLVTAGTAIYAFNLPNVYTATAVVLPPRKAGGGLLESLTSGLSSTFKDLGVTKIGGSEASAYTPLSLINSRELRESIVRDFNLQKLYGSTTFDDAVKEFNEYVDGEVTEFASFRINFTNEDPKLAASVANALVDKMNATSMRLASEEARINRAFVELRYQKCIADLDSAEQQLDHFQRKYGLYLLPEQAKAQVTAIAGIEQQKYISEVQLNAIEQLYGTQAPEALALRSSIEEYERKLSELDEGTSGSQNFVATNLMPEAALGYLRVMREVELQSKLKAFLLPAYEQAKLDESKKTVSFLTLDRAVAPNKKSAPRRSIMLLVALMGTMTVTSAGVLFSYRIRQARANFQTDRKALGLGV